MDKTLLSTFWQQVITISDNVTAAVFTHFSQIEPSCAVVLIRFSKSDWIKTAVRLTHAADSLTSGKVFPPSLPPPWWENGSRVRLVEGLISPDKCSECVSELWQLCHPSSSSSVASRTLHSPLPTERLMCSQWGDRWRERERVKERTPFLQSDSTPTYCSLKCPHRRPHPTHSAHSTALWLKAKELKRDASRLEEEGEKTSEENGGKGMGRRKIEREGW